MHSDPAGGDGSSVGKRGEGREKRAIVSVRRCSFWGPPGPWAGSMRQACAARFGLGPVKLRGSAREQEQSMAYAAQVHVGALAGIRRG